MSKNLKIGHDPFVYGPRRKSSGWPTQHKSHSGAKSGKKIITIDNNSNTKAICAPPKGHRILKQDNMVPPHQG